jgi:hypothetical protein
MHARVEYQQLLPKPYFYFGWLKVWVNWIYANFGELEKLPLQMPKLDICHPLQLAQA